MERRNFILAAGSLIGAPALARAASLAAPPPAASGLRMAGFRDLVGQQFLAFQGKRGTTLDLVALRPGKAAPHHEQFTLVFSGEPALASGIYEIDNTVAGRMQVYLESAGAAKGATGDSLYRAEFSLLV
ncbi:hypothetical protein GM658_25745 [Pseudoduganella eburnea]|uniref:DUF6916 domain-containing protein n=1 Tax=Massilia eburnea TaxID=1776165 RepID=A0A6L6QNR1_9BURK|nr:hypothetical protein [Massilia eburnea]MTW14022.1 hypothetical protein [Massilia eburnea]